MKNKQPVTVGLLMSVMGLCFTLLGGSFTFLWTELKGERNERMEQEKTVTQEIVKLRILTEKIAFKLEIPTETKVSQGTQSSVW